MNLLFWNMHKADNSRLLCRCVEERLVDVALFAEHQGVDFDCLDIVQRGSYKLINGFGGCDKIQMIASSECEVEIVFESSRYVISEIAIHGTKYLVMGVHMPDRMSHESEERVHFAALAADDLRRTRSSSDAQHCLVAGDFNANPFDKELVAPYTFNAVLFRKLIEKSETCVFQGVRYTRLYNPVLDYISEATETYGSYYFTSKPGIIWYSLDQALVSKSLARKIQDFQYLKTIGNTKLLTATCPDSKISDHLPLLIRVGELGGEND